jgi:GNAT superfamily N-acetyltransferase
LIQVRPSTTKDHNAIWKILEPIFRAGDTYAQPTDIFREEALSYWLGCHNTGYVATDDSQILGTYYIGPNQLGGGAHVCNCGFATAPAARGQGIARKMLKHALETALSCNYKAMQFNFVVQTNADALKIWSDNEFTEIGRLPQAFKHPTLGFIDALVLHKTL